RWPAFCLAFSLRRCCSTCPSRLAAIVLGPAKKKHRPMLILPRAKRSPSIISRYTSEVEFLGAQWTASALAVYASQCGSHRPTQDSLPAASQALPGGIGYPQGLAMARDGVSHFIGTVHSSRLVMQG